MQGSIGNGKCRRNGAGGTDNSACKVGQSNRVRLIWSEFRVVEVVNGEVYLSGTAWNGKVDVLDVSADGREQVHLSQQGTLRALECGEAGKSKSSRGRREASEQQHIGQGIIVDLELDIDNAEAIGEVECELLELAAPALSIINRTSVPE